MYYKISEESKELMTDLAIGVMTEGEFMAVTGRDMVMTVLDEKSWQLSEFPTIVVCTTGCGEYIPVYEVMALNKYKGGKIEVACHACKTKRHVAPIC